MNIPLRINQNIMMEKIKELLGSRKFWLVTIAAVAKVLEADVITTQIVMGVVYEWALFVAGIGLVQGSAERLSGKWNK